VITTKSKVKVGSKESIVIDPPDEEEQLDTEQPTPLDKTKLNIEEAKMNDLISPDIGSISDQAIFESPSPQVIKTFHQQQSSDKKKESPPKKKSVMRNSLDDSDDSDFDQDDFSEAGYHAPHSVVPEV